MDLAGELAKSEAALSDEKLKTDELSAKLSKLSIRNMNKILKRRDNKIKESQCCMDNLIKEIETKSAATHTEITKLLLPCCNLATALIKVYLATR